MGHRLKLLLMLVAPLALAAVASDLSAVPVGYFIDNRIINPDAELTEQDTGAFLTRGEQRIAAVEGMPVFAGDVVSTDADGSIGIVFRDSSAVTLRSQTVVKIEDYAYPARKVPTHLIVESGKAFFSVNPRPAEAHFFVSTRGGPVEVKGTKFEILSVMNSDKTFTTSVAVTDGTVTLAPHGTTAVDVKTGTSLTMLIHSTSVAGYSGASVDLQKGNLSSDQIKALKAMALSDIMVSLKGESVAITTIVHNPDGTISSQKLTEISGHSVKSQSSIKNGKLTIAKVSVQYDSADNIKSLSVTRVDGTQSLSDKYTTKGGKATFKDKATKASYSGNFRVVNDSGIKEIQISDMLNKAKNRLVMVWWKGPDGSVTQVTTKFDPGATEGAQTWKITNYDGSTKTYSEKCTTVQRTNGTFEAIGAPTFTTTTPKSDSPPPPGISAPGVNIEVVPDPQPISP
ncbi:MAG TPA: FecR family protein [Planctomycetota bacterium]|jgi:hypothetical protein